MKKTKEFHIRVTEKVFNTIRKIAEKDRRTVTTVIDIALEIYLMRKK